MQKCKKIKQTNKQKSDRISVISMQMQMQMHHVLHFLFLLFFCIYILIFCICILLFWFCLLLLLWCYIVDNFGGPTIDSWFNEPMAEVWAQWIDTKYSRNDQLLPSQVMAQAGYYTSLLRPGFRIISIQTGYIQPGNFYISFSWNPDIDMGGQYKWLQFVLSSARQLNETVVIIQHYPVTGPVPLWKQKYYELYAEYGDMKDFWICFIWLLCVCVVCAVTVSARLPIMWFIVCHTHIWKTNRKCDFIWHCFVLPHVKSDWKP